MRRTAIYKCRMCNEVFKTCTAGSEGLAVKIMYKITNDLPYNDPLAPTLYYTHTCDDGSLGLADFIGMRKDD